MPLKINSLNDIKKRLNIQEDGPIQAFFTNTCYKAMDEFVPMSANNSQTSLRKNVMVTTNAIYYMSPYAKYQYKGERDDGTHKVKNYTTPGTGPYWDERMKSAKMDKVVKDVKNEMRRLNK